MIELWNVSRALGLVALLLMGVVLALGALHNTSLTRIIGQALPRFVLVALHRNLALITVVFVVLHVVTVFVTPYLPLRWFHLVVPGTATFNPWPAGLGAVAFDLLLAVVISSSLRRYLPKRAWLVVHWTTYLCFPVAVAHAVANASFRGGTWWTLLVPLLASGLVVGALLYRRAGRRRPASVPLADRGRTDPGEARRAADHATGSQPVIRAEPAGGATGGGADHDTERDADQDAAKAPFAASDAANDAFAHPGSGAPGSAATGSGAAGSGAPARARRGAVREMRVVARPAAQSGAGRVGQDGNQPAAQSAAGEVPAARRGAGDGDAKARPAADDVAGTARARHAADPDDDAGADAHTDTLAGPETPTVALPPRPRRR